MAQVYRFRAAVAINPGEGPTRYLDAPAARALAAALLDLADDIDARPFPDSTIGPRAYADHAAPPAPRNKES